MLFEVFRADEFGVKLRYLLALSGSDSISSSDVDGLFKIAECNRASLVVVGDTKSKRTDVAVVTQQEFEGRMGGIIPSFLPLEPDYAKQLAILGLNKLPKGLKGRADDLFEAYVHTGLQFMLQDKVVRYGQERRFEVVPDGLVLGREDFVLLYDCKAAKDGYDVDRDSIRQFSDYVNSFHERYGGYVGRLHAFLVISGKFKSENTLEQRSRELYAECKVPLVFMKADELGKIVSLFAERTALRQSVDWAKLFSATSVTVFAVEKEIAARERDQVVAASRKRAGK